MPAASWNPCLYRASGDLQCAPSPKEEPFVQAQLQRPRPPPTPPQLLPQSFAQITANRAATGPVAAYVRNNEEIGTWTEGGGFARKGGAGRQVAIDGTFGCVLAGNGDVWCSRDMASPAQDWYHPGGNGKAISISGRNACVIAGPQAGPERENSVWCTRDITAPSVSWYEKGGRLLNVSVDGQRACGVAPDKSIFCTDDVHQLDWRRVPGSLEQVSLAGNRLCGTTRTGDIWCGNPTDGSFVRRFGTAGAVALGRNGIAAGPTRTAQELSYGQL